MVFSSHIFVYYFLPLALLGYYALSRAPQRWRNSWLILTGYTFYGWAEPRFMPLMFATTFVDWLVSLIIAHDTWRFWTIFPSSAGKSSARTRPSPRAKSNKTDKNLIGVESR